MDDEPAVVDGLRRRLQTAGYRCLSAANGREGFTIAEEARPDLILLDMRMPVCGGIESLAELRRCEATREIPVIVISGNEFDQAAALEAGADDFLAKPYRAEQLLTAIRIRCERHTGPNPSAGAGLP
ncbi:MAG: response regulator [Planctomycetales bacterium]